MNAKAIIFKIIIEIAITVVAGLVGDYLVEKLESEEVKNKARAILGKKHVEIA